jgi:hypothetical protein
LVWSLIVSNGDSEDRKRISFFKIDCRIPKNLSFSESRMNISGCLWIKSIKFSDERVIAEGAYEMNKSL